MTARLLITASLVLAITSPGLAQRRRKPAPKRHAVSKRKPAAVKPRTFAKPPIVGSQVTIVLKTGERITGPVSDVSVQGIKVGGNDLETVIPFESVASLYFNVGPAGTENKADQAGTEERPRQHHVLPTRDLEALLAAFQTMDALVKSGPDYTDYSRQLTELRRSADRFVGKYSTSDDPTEVRIAALVAGAIDDYTWARTIWTLRLGRAKDVTVAASDSPAVADAVQLYPDLAPPAGTNPAADKLITGLARHAAEKMDSARKLIPPPDK
ncbi:MAG: hypothetical protein ACREDR_18055 [Blastocatellia bacterium]